MNVARSTADWLGAPGPGEVAATGCTFRGLPRPRFTGVAVAAHKEDEDVVELESESDESDESCHGIVAAQHTTQADKQKISIPCKPT